MTAPHKKNYTNADIIKRLDSMDGRLGSLETWKISQEAGRAAVDEYKRQEESDKLQRSRNSAYNGVKDLLPYIIAVLGAAAALIYAHIASGVK